MYKKNQKFSWLLLVLLMSLFWTSFVGIAMGRENVHPFQALFYQPHTSDLQQNREWWHKTMKRLHDQGITSLYIQWTRHGSVDFLTRPVEGGPPLIPLLLTLGEQYQIKLHIGLYADPDFFTRIKQSPKALQVYLKRLRVLSLQQAKEIKKLTPGRSSLAGLYLYEEIDDVNWRSGKRRNFLHDHLQKEYQQLHDLFPDKQIAISTFFTGKMSPESYAGLWKQLIQDTSLMVMVQDGAGSNTIDPEDRFVYFNALYNALPSQHWTVILELFHQDHSSPTFKADPADISFSKKYLGRLEKLAIIPPVAFSLRYITPIPK